MDWALFWALFWAIFWAIFWLYFCDFFSSSSGPSDLFVFVVSIDLLKEYFLAFFMEPFSSPPTSVLYKHQSLTGFNQGCQMCDIKTVKKLPNGHKISQKSVKYSRRPQNISTFAILRSSKIWCDVRMPNAERRNAE
jgi:hypothetical protein